MSTLYLIGLFGVSIAILAALVEAIIAVSRPAQWVRARGASPIRLVQTEERRLQQLPHVGVERRQSPVARPDDVQPRRIA